MVNVKPTNLGNTTRMNFAKINEVMEMPNLIEVQKNSYQWFLDVGLKEVFRDISEITDYTGNLVLEFIDYKMDDHPKYTVKECKERDATYAAPLRVTARLYNKETGEVKESDVYMGDFPLMTESGTFVINGAERAIVSQLVRSPGVYFDMTHDKTGKELYTSTVIPNRGAWLEYESDQNDIFYVRIDKNRKLYITTFIRALGLGTNQEILDFFGADERIMATLERDTTKNAEEALLEVYKKLRPGEPPTLETAQAHLDGLFFDAHRYDLSRVGRYKYNKKLAISQRLVGNKLAQPIINEATGELLADAGEIITADKAYEIEQAGVMQAFVDVDGKEIKVVSNGMVDALPYLKGLKITEDELEEIAINEKVRYSILMEVLATSKKKKDVLEALAVRCDDLIPKHIIIDDIFASINYMNCLAANIGTIDDIDHLGNRRIRSVGELLQNQFRIGFTRMERVVRERMSLQAQEPEKATPQALINIRPVVAAVKEFFGSSPLSQFMDQTNPLAELTHKRRLSALGPGGLSRDRAGFEVRDVHYSHYGRMCPIETPEGPNIGLISYLATFARINKYGFIEAPFRKIDKETGRVLDEVVYMTADVEDNYRVAQANEPLDEEGHFMREKVTIRYRDGFDEVDRSIPDYMDVSPRMLVSVATAMIPFLENDDANRALMGSNMQRQAVPLMKTQAPFVGTGMEHKAAVDSGVVVLAKRAGKVIHVDADSIEIETDKGEIDSYELIKFMRSNQGTCVNQRPIVSLGQKVVAKEVIADGPATSHGEISLGKNALIGFMTWEGYNYEDAVLLNEKIVRDDVYTSIHIEEYELEARDTKLGPEEITRDIPNVGDDALADLDEFGIIRIGAEVHSGDILVGKVTPKGETELTAEERLLRAIFGEKAREVRDTSLRVPHGEYGIVVNVEVFTRENSDELSPGVNKVVRCYIAQKRKIQVGDKMAGRHGNKGVVSRILPQEDMPFLPDGTPLDIVLNPLGVPSRMNIGQVLEVNIGMAARLKGWKIMTPVFDGAHEEDVQYFLSESKLLSEGNDKIRELVLKYEDMNAKTGYNLVDLIEFLKANTKTEEEHAFIDAAYEYRFGKTKLIDGRTGKPFDNPVTVGVMYYLKLHHLVDDKIHARSTGPYSLVTQQPLGGKAQFGGQRFGEMEVWALEAYGAAYTLQEILTIKSDDIVGRVKTYEAIVKGQSVPKSGVPESFKVLIKELQSLGLDVKVLDKDDNEIDLKQNFDTDDVNFRLVENENFKPQYVNDAEGAEGFATTLDENGEVIEEEFDEEAEFSNDLDDIEGPTDFEMGIEE
ncbi:MAG: DNA-directed RNA polymerase subunit beta [Clostridia bacterium]|nr:DNA-directed RNA polymerase subunit beta [Candidatus Limimonas egerieequi]MCQ2489174.1 DNA-directed RNA polymerase subunit beta [Clostridia bacterium]